MAIKISARVPSAPQAPQNPMRIHRVLYFPKPKKTCFHKGEGKYKTIAAYAAMVLRRLKGNPWRKGPALTELIAKNCKFLQKKF